MSRSRGLVLTIAVTGMALGLLAAARPLAHVEKAVAHIVVFTLKDHSAEARDRFVKSCHKYLSDHEGTLYFAVGTIAEDVVEPVSDREFDIVLHLVFQDKAALQKYHKDPRHQKFVEENKASFAKVRVFDSYLAKP